MKKNYSVTILKGHSETESYQTINKNDLKMILDDYKLNIEIPEESGVYTYVGANGFWNWVLVFWKFD